MDKTFKAVVLNDTRVDRHAGCILVMDNLIRKLKERNICVLATNEVRRNWRENESFLAALHGADLLVVNGEGTLHGLHPDDMSHRIELVKISEYAKRIGVKAVLVNSVYQSNPGYYKDYLSLFDLITVRESISYDEIDSLGVSARVVPDLTFATEISPSLSFLGRLMRKVYYTDSAILSISESIKDEARAFDCFSKFLPITTPEENYNEQSRFACDYLVMLERAKFLFCGRFHSLTLALLLQRPFIAYSSNTHKIEGLLMDVGLIRRLSVGPSRKEISDLSNFSLDESRTIAKYVTKA